jgi:hypothetical protein
MRCRISVVEALRIMLGQDYNCLWLQYSDHLYADKSFVQKSNSSVFFNGIFFLEKLKSSAPDRIFSVRHIRIFLFIFSFIFLRISVNGQEPKVNLVLY